MFDTPQSTERTEALPKREIKYGRGVFVWKNMKQWGPTIPQCRIKQTGACGLFQISTNGKSPSKEEWLKKTFPSEIDSPQENGPFPTPQDWVSFAPGREEVYALREGGHQIDRINDQGKVSLFAQDSSSDRWNQLLVYEIGDLHLVVRQHESQENSPFWEIAELSEPDAKGIRSIGKGAILPMLPVTKGRPNAQGARSATLVGKQAMFGEPQIVRLDTGKKWAMVWLEIIPPDYGWPKGKPQKLAPLKKKAKNGCGGPASRTLDDRSVEKRAHVTYMEGATVVEDIIAWTTSSLNPYGYKLSFQIKEGKVTVTPPPKKIIKHSDLEMSGFWGGNDFYADVNVSPKEDMEKILFDPETEEGLALVQTEKGEQARRFDARGAWIGDPISVKYWEFSNSISYTQFQNNWYAIPSYRRELLSLNEDPIPISAPDSQFLSLYQRDGMLRILSLHEGILWEITLKDKAVAGPPERLTDLPSGMDNYRIEILPRKNARPIVAGSITPRGEDPFRIAWKDLNTEGPWNKVNPYPDNIKESPMGGILPRYNDFIAIYQKDKKLYLTWLLSGQPAVVEEVQNEKDPGLIGNFLQQREKPVDLRWLPNKPGPTRKSPELIGLEDTCEQMVMTRADTALFLCAEPMDPIKPGYRVGLRAYTHPAE